MSSRPTPLTSLCPLCSASTSSEIHWQIRDHQRRGICDAETPKQGHQQHRAIERIPNKESNRYSMSSTLGSNDNDDVLRRKLIKSQKTFLLKQGAPAWTDSEKAACLLFYSSSCTVSLKDVKARNQEAGIVLSNDASFGI